jgi:hypothetical protein
MFPELVALQGPEGIQGRKGRSHKIQQIPAEPHPIGLHHPGLIKAGRENLGLGLQDLLGRFQDALGNIVGCGFGLGHAHLLTQGIIGAGLGRPCYERFSVFSFRFSVKNKKKNRLLDN